MTVISWRLSYKFWNNGIASYRSREFATEALALQEIASLRLKAKSLVDDAGYFDVRLTRVTITTEYGETEDIGNFRGPDFRKSA